MATITAKITKAEVAQDGQVTVTIELTDATNFTWVKNYSFYTTQEIDLASFKNRVVADIRADLNIAKQLDQIKPHIGKTFTLTV